MRRRNFPLLEYAGNDHKKNKQASRIIMMLAALFIVSFAALITVASARAETGLVELQRENASLATAVLHDASEAQIKKIRDLSYVDDSCEQKLFGYILYSGNKAGTCVGMSEDGFYKLFAPAYESVTGKFPQSEDEIMLSEDTLILMGIDHPRPGMKIDADFILKGRADEIGKSMSASLTLSGYYSVFHSDENHLPAAYFSLGFPENESVTPCDTDLFFRSSLIWLKAEHLENQIYEDLGYEEGQQLSVINLGRTQILQEMFGSLVLVVSAIIILAVTTYVSLLNMIHIHTNRERRQYQLLKVLGVTDRQFRTILFLKYFPPVGEGLLIGFLSGYLTAYMIIRFFSEVYSSPLHMLPFRWIAGITLMIGAESLLAVFVGSKKTKMRFSRKLKRAGRRETGRSESAKKRNVLLTIAWKHSIENTRQLLITIISLFLGIEVFLISVIICHGIDPVHKWNNEKDFRIGITKQAVENYFYENDGMETGDVIQTQFLSNAFIQRAAATAQAEISDLELCQGYPGIADHEVNSVFSNFYHSMDEPFTGVTIQAVSSQWIEKLDEYCSKNRLDVDIDSFTKGDGFILLYNHPGVRYEKQIQDAGGDPLKLYFFGQKKEAVFHCSGVLNVSEKGFPDLYMPWDGDISDYMIISQKAVDAGKLTPQIYEIAFDVSPKDETVIKKKLTQLIAGYNEDNPGSSSFYMISKSDELEKAKAFIQMTRLIMGIFSSVLLFLAMVNYLLTIHMRIESEKEDILLLGKVGLSQREIRKYITFETLIYIFFTCISIFTLGLAAIRFIREVMEKSVDYFAYSFPLGGLLLILILIFGIGCAAGVHGHQQIITSENKKA